MLRKDISGFTYSPRSLRYNIKSEDFWKYKNYDLTPDNVEDITNKISEKFSNEKAVVDNFKTYKIRDNIIFTNSTLYNALTIRRTNEILKNT